MLYKMPYLVRPLQSRPLVNGNISKKFASLSIKESEKLIYIHNRTRINTKI